MIDHMNTVARRKVGGPEGWRYYRWERIGEGMDFIVKGGVPRELKSGPNKGRPTWRDVPTQKTVVTEMELNAARASYEAETGNCHECGGDGEVFKSWSVADGTQMKPCARCAGTGKAPNAIELTGLPKASPNDRRE